MTDATHHTKPIPVVAVQWDGTNINSVAAMIIDNGYGIRWDRNSGGNDEITDVEVSLGSDSNDDLYWQEIDNDDWLVIEEGAINVVNPDYFTENYTTSKGPT